MNLEQYAAQQAQAPQRAQSAPQAQDILSAQLDAEKLYSLMAETEQAIKDKARPADLAQMITGNLFGVNSPQAAAVADAIKEDQHPGGYEIAIASIRAQRRLLQKQARAIADELEKLETVERDLIREGSEAAALDRALLDVLTFIKAPEGDSITRLYDRHHNSPGAMGLLYSYMATINATDMDMVQWQEFCKLRNKIAQAINTPL